MKGEINGLCEWCGRQKICGGDGWVVDCSHYKKPHTMNIKKIASELARAKFRLETEAGDGHDDEADPVAVHAE